MRRRVTDEELDALSAEPRVGEVWWCAGESLHLSDGGKTRPVLILTLSGETATVAPLTTRRTNTGIAVRHIGGLSWLTATRATVSRLSLLSTLGAWAGFAARQTGGRE